MRARHDGNTSRGMRVRDIYRGLLERVGGEADVLAAAELKVACEDLRGKMLAGEAVDSNHLVRMQNLCDRAERRLVRFERAKSKRPYGLADIQTALARDDDEDR